MAQILRAEDVDMNNLTFSSTAKNLDNGMKIVSLSYNGKPLTLQTPKMSVPFGVSRWENGKASLELSLGLFSADPELSRFHDLLQRLNARCLEEGMMKSVTWFKRKFSDSAILEALFTSTLKHNTNKPDLPPTFKANLPQRDGAYQFEAYDEAKNKVDDIDALDLRGGHAVCIVQCSGIWIAAGKFGMTWKVVQMKVFSPDNSFNNNYSSNSTSRDSPPRAGAGGAGYKSAQLSGFAFVQDDD